MLPGTRYVKHIGRYDNVSDKVTSTEGAVDGCVSCGNPNVAREGYAQKGGAYYGMATGSGISVHAGGPTGGVMPIVSGSGCGVERESGLGAGSQAAPLQKGGNGYGSLAEGNTRYGVDLNESVVADVRGSYAPIKGSTTSVCGSMVGGRKVCHDLRKVKHFRQVHAFWASICPGAVVLYHNHLKDLEKDHGKKVLRVVKHYTKAFCHEVNALNATTKKAVKEEMKGLKESLGKAEGILMKIAPKSHKLHKMIVARHVGTVEKALHKLGKKTRKHSKASRKGGSKHSKTSRKSRRGTRRRRKSMKGGYTQFGSDKPYTPSYEVTTNGGWQMGTPGAKLNPNCDNCTDNYNHYTGKGFDTPAYDQDVQA